VRPAAAHVFVDDLAGPALSDEDFHHLSRVLRLRAGEEVSASDGRGGWRPCRWAGTAALHPAGEAVLTEHPVPRLTVAFALVKGERPEWAVQKLTEAGVDRLVLMTSARSVVRWDEARAPRQLERLRSVARLAAMQSRRVWLPSLEGPVPFSVLTAGGGTGELAGLAIADPDGGPLTLATPTVLIGPEGGWSEDELAAVPARACLGPHVLRAETAAVAAGVLLAALRAGLVAPEPSPRDQ
jgi:16S rRNA (uracil1498-N3)-methyltransferase